MKVKTPLSSSKLARTILKTNPGIDRVTSEKLEAVDKISSKKSKIANHQIRLFVNKFEGQRSKRTRLYDRLKPKLEPNSRNSIEKYKIEARLSRETKSTLTLIKTSKKKPSSSTKPFNVDQFPDDEDNYAANIDENCPTSFDETEEIHETVDMLSRRSSIRSSILEATGPSSQEGSELVVDDDKAETKDDGDAKSLSAYMNLIPAPTPTRFVGKMQKVREDKKKSESSLSSSRRGSVFPVGETIEEAVEVDTTNNIAPTTPEKQEASSVEDTKPAADAKTSPKLSPKMKIGSVVGNMRKMGVTRKESVSLDNSKSSTPSSSVIGTKDSMSSTPSTINTKKTSDKDKRKGSSGLSSFKAKTGLLGGKSKKKQDKDKEAENKVKQLKHRLFFLDKQELTDQEVLDAIGADHDQVPKVVGQSINEIAHAATFMKKFLKGKAEDDKSSGSAGGGMPNSMLYIGALKARLSRTGDDLMKRDDASNLTKTPVFQSTVFLGKMKVRKDR